MLKNLEKAPFPWFGGKSQAAPIVWAALGDVGHYVEPFAGSLAVLLNRPHLANRPYHSETVNDLDGLLVNAWRAIQLHPDATAEAASNPVAEADLHARHLALVRWRESHELEYLMGDPLFCDPLMAGWWIWGCSCWIGGGWASGVGPWIVGQDGRIERRAPGGKTGGVKKELPHLSDNGQGVNHAGAREPGVSRQIPHLGNDGQGVNHAGAREPGVSRKIPHLSDDGRGVNHAGAREPGVNRQIPHLGNNGQGVNHAGAREPGCEAAGSSCWDPSVPEEAYHPITMPEVRRWFAFLSSRLRHVRILNGDWKRVLTTGATKTINVRKGTQKCGVFLDPPYADSANRDAALYSCDSGTVAHDAATWAIEHGADPDYRIVFAGYDGEHGSRFVDAGWRKIEWFVPGYLRGGMGNLGKGKGKTHQQHRERMYLSPHCLAESEIPVDPRQQDLFGGTDETDDPSDD